ncbi:cation-independent mannose-6-phosphate receptor isoform X1 [Dromiciops gliroides]|uniref:cation-independent mannose-6-phosphate receptor isoform X1 n=2 Tax=Dromiciops gliroides TaxID=33562 RepID=UPI001CC79E40|nr:cation-independent mannose-6-phosphate receptor isoform X1 [Dromiciops gliroides]
MGGAAAASTTVAAAAAAPAPSAHLRPWTRRPPRPLPPPPPLLLLLLLFVSARGISKAQSFEFPELCSYTWEAVDVERRILYKINLCGNMTIPKCESSAICAYDLKNLSYHSVGDLSLKNGTKSLMEFSTGDQCLQQDRRTTVHSSIAFLCGKTLGTPEFVTSTECVHYFEWRTTVACKKETFKANKEVPCYVFDHELRKHDLNPLINTSGSYLVDDSDRDTSLFINICRDIGGSSQDTHFCPPGSAACLVKGNQGYDVGRPKEGLKLVGKDRLVLSYVKEGEDQPTFCNGHIPAVTITFICPSERREGTVPKLTAKSNCRYEIEWVTEYACHRDYLESKNCILNNEQHDISIDLNPLSQKKAYESPYYATDGKEYFYYMNVCRGTEAQVCKSKRGAAVCQVKKEDPGQVKVAGKYQNQTLRYSDGDLTLIYPGGDACGSGFQRMTVINFECNKTAVNDGKGTPVFTGEVDCTYFFTWGTKYACVKEKEDLLCRVTDGNKRYDLSSLVRHSELEKNWEAVDSSHIELGKKHIFINICHKVLQEGKAKGCPEDAAICSVGDQGFKNLGKFVSSPIKNKDNIQLSYSEGDNCGKNKKITTIITLICKPGDLESAPVLRNSGDNGCLYEFEWHTAAACVLSKTEGDNCRVTDSQAGFSFDLSPLTKKNGDYSVGTGKYNFYINVCGAVSQDICLPNSGACQVEKSQRKAWNLGINSSALSYYDGMIQLSYKGGTPYNDEKHTPRATLITFLCDRDAGIGVPEYQEEDNSTYNFRWYTSYACPEEPLECMVTDPSTLEQYDLSSLAKSEDSSGRNWYAMDNFGEHSTWKKYYINICRPLNPIPGCDRNASACQMKYEKDQDSFSETVAISNLGVAKTGPIIDGNGSLILEYVNGSSCINSEGKTTTYSTRIHLICSRGSLNTHPVFSIIRECTATFLWNTEAACPIKTTDENQACSIRDPNSGFVFNFDPLAKPNGYVVSGVGKTFMFNICGTLPACGTIEGKDAAGCEGEIKSEDLNDLKPERRVGAKKSLHLTTEGFITLIYRGALSPSTGASDAFIIRFICNDDIYRGKPKFIRQDINSELGIYDTFFELETALACVPSPVDCQVTDLAGNEYDLSGLSRTREPWIALDTSTEGKKRTFYLNVCNPLPHIPGCYGSALGSCVKSGDTGTNLGVVQISPQTAANGSLSIVYVNGDKCENQRFSTRIIFECDQAPGSPVFQHKEGCEYVFVWRTIEACPIRKAEGDNCEVKDPRHGHIYNLRPLAVNDTKVTAGEYNYYFRVCGSLSSNMCKHLDSSKKVSSCQEKKGLSPFQKIAGLLTQKLTYENGLIKINYTGGDTCHKIYQRSTTIFFYCDRVTQKPVFLKETLDCSYLFEWRTQYACPPFESIECSFRDHEGNSFDLSSLSRYNDNWEAITRTGATERYFINVCKSLAPQPGIGSCPPDAAVCLVENSKYTTLGRVSDGPKWSSEGTSILKYLNGDLCPDKIRRKMTTIFLTCSVSHVDSKPMFISAVEDCEYTFSWQTSAACPLKSNTQENCQVTNPATGHLFDLNSLKNDSGYSVPYSEKGLIYIGICGGTKNCPSGVGVCFGLTKINAGSWNKRLMYVDQVLQLVYDDGAPCPSKNALKYKSVISFVCTYNSGATNKPVFVSLDKQTCTIYFSWHTPLACEKEEQCSVKNGSSVIDLSPLIHRTGGYEAYNENDLSDTKPDFYINICQALNPIYGVSCPAGSAVCKIPVDGSPIDVGRVTGPPQINHATNEIYMTFDSSTPCPSDRNANYSSIILFHCKRGISMGSPKMIKSSGCDNVFEWETPIVCPDDVKTIGCSVTDEQLYYSFNLSSLSKRPVKVTYGPHTYNVGVCAAANSDPQGSCKDGGVCLLSGSKASSFGRLASMSLDYRHQDETVILKYLNGDQCPPETEQGDPCVFPFTYNGKSYDECIREDKQKPWCATTENYARDQKWGYCRYSNSYRSSTIIFSCDENIDIGSPKVFTETRGCEVTFEWKTKVVCPPKKMDCKFIQKHKTYDLRLLSSLTGSWLFVHDGTSYYINLCQSIYKGPSGCPERASICKKSITGTVQVLGLVHTQKLDVTGDNILVTYSNGYECSRNKTATTVIELKCAKTVGKPMLKRFDIERCTYYIMWETRAACAVKPQEVEMVNGTIINPVNDKRLSLGEIYFKSFSASGDMRPNGDAYMYEIQLSSITNSANPLCYGASICQVKTNDQHFGRQVGSLDKTRYYIQDDDLDVVFSSSSKCGKDNTKYVSSTIFFHCDPSAKEGIPEFSHETADCQYLFSWYTSAVCPLGMEIINDRDENAPNHKGLSGRSQAVGAILSLLLVVLTACLLIMLLYKKERRETVMHRISNCCKRSSNVSYKYTKVNTEEEADENETEWLMEEIQLSASRPGKEGQENGHITTKSVKSDALTSLHADDQDSEDEVLTIPDVKIHLARGTRPGGPDKVRNLQRKTFKHGNDDTVGLLKGEKERKGKPQSGQQKAMDSAYPMSFHDDSDEDLLHV